MKTACADVGWGVEMCAGRVEYTAQDRDCLRTCRENFLLIKHFFCQLNDFFVICSKDMVQHPHGNDLCLSVVCDCPYATYKIIVDIEHIVYDHSSDASPEH